MKKSELQKFRGGLEKLDLWLNLNLTKRDATVLN